MLVLKVVTALAALSLVLALAQSGQATGSIQGTVVDSSGAPIPGVRVRALMPATGASRETATADTGQFQFRGLAPGAYTLTLEKEGFTKISVEPFAVSIGQTVVHRLTMNPAQVIERLEVKEQPEAIAPAATTSSVALGGERIEESPAQNRNYLNFVLVAPGVASSTGSNAQRSAAGQRSAASDSGFTFAGMRGRNNSLSIDGVDNRDETTGGNRVAIGLEMVQEFRVSGTSVGAEFGGAAGGAVNVVTRSGTNVWHGDGTFFAQNETLNARNSEALTRQRPRFRRYQPGTSIMGPVRKDRTFFATAIEQEWESADEWSDAPDAALAALNRALAGAAFSRAAVREVERGLFPSDSSETEFSFKANHQAGRNHSLSARYAFSRGRIGREVLGVDNFSDVSARGTSLTRDQSAVGGWVFVPSAHLVNDLRVQFARRTVAMDPNSRGAMLEIPGMVTLGQAYRLDASRTEDHYELVDSVTAARGGHELTAGGDLHRIRLDARLANRFGGAFLFPNPDAFAAGRPDVFFQAFGDPRTRLNTLPAALWLQDRWRAAKGLSIEAGARLDMQRMPAALPGPGWNVAPRLGLAYRPGADAHYVLRAGFGLFYDRFPLAFLNDAVQQGGRTGFEQYVAGPDAAVAFALARGGSLTTPLPGVPKSVYTASSNFPATYGRKFAAGIERALGKNTSATVEYSWVRGFHLPRTRNVSGGLPAVWLLEQSSSSAYQGASVSVNRRMSRELTFLAAYSIGRTHDDASDFDEQPLDPFNTRGDWARSRQDQLHRLAASALFELPVPESGGPRWLGVFERITLAPMLTAGSGRPLNALDSTDAFRTGAYPISARPFSLPRNPFLSRGTRALDLRVMKTIPVKRERALLQFGAEGFNLTNHSNALRVSPYYAAGGQRLDSYGYPVETLNARQVQLMIQFEY